MVTSPRPDGHLRPSPLDRLLGVELVRAGPDGCVVRLTVTPELHQPTGQLHGGVLATLVESAASVAADLWLGEQGTAVGVSNTTDFLRPVRDGVLHAEATPLQRGRTMQLWAVDVTDESGRRVAHGQLRLANLRADAG